MAKTRAGKRLVSVERGTGRTLIGQMDMRQWSTSSVGQDVLEVLVGACLVIAIALGVAAGLSTGATSAGEVGVLQVVAWVALVAAVLAGIGARAAMRAEARAHGEMIAASRRAAAAADVAAKAAERYFEVLEGGEPRRHT